MAHVLVLSTGGTISSRRAQGGAVVASDDAATLTGQAGPVAGHHVEAIDLMRIGSYQMRLGDLRAISDAVADYLAREGEDAVDGIVITHGTDTIEETAILLDLVHDDPRPVVLTGAQRAADVPDTDGPRNLADAIAVAGSPQSRDAGVLVCFAGDILAARGTRKMHTLALAPFRTLDGGPIGTVRDGHVQIHTLPWRPKALQRPGATFDDTRVDAVSVYPGADDSLLRASVKAGARGVVIAGSGIGNGNPVIAEAIAELSGRGVVVALSSRVPEGPVVPMYGHGGGADLVGSGAVVAEGMPSYQVRILLALLLASGLPPPGVRRRLTEYS